MIYLIIIVVLLIFINPYVDFFKDYRGKNHLIIWYNDLIKNIRHYYKLF
jgi:hypothetical protein